MKSKNLIALVASIALVLALLLTGCPSASPTPTATATPTPTATATATPTVTPTSTPAGVDLTYNCLNPRGIEPAVTIKPLAPRLDTLDGKVIYVNAGEADPVIMPALWEVVNETYLKTTWKYIFISGFGPNVLEAEVLNIADAVIRGISW